MTEHLAKTMPPAGRVTLSRSGKVFAVNRNEAVLEAALRQEIWLPHACRGGSCGSCRAIVVSGSLTYDDGRSFRGGGQTTSRPEALLCCAKLLGDVTLDIAELDARPTGTVFRRPARVVEIAKPSCDVAIVTLQPPPTATIRFRPGQYICVVGQDGRLHPFSIANAPRTDGTLELHVGRIPNGRFTSFVHEELCPRDIVRFEGPFGEFGFSDAVQRPAILLAGGTGIAPIKAMLEGLKHATPKRELYLYWGSRRPEGFYAAGMIPAFECVRATPVLSESLDADRWPGRIGLVHRAVLEDFPDLSSFDVYACGSPRLIEAAFYDFTHVAALPPERFFDDAFNHAGTIREFARTAG
jgi:CDP-4-dehydro-6-deoxyglucose reductase, E3